MGSPVKYHIGPYGPRACSAQVQRCPFGGSENHFNSRKEAQVEYEYRLEYENDKFNYVRKNSSQ